MLVRILKVKEWKFHNQVMSKLQEYFQVAQMSEHKKKLILYHYTKLLNSGKFNGKMMETLKGVDLAIDNWKNKRKNSKY